MVDKQFAREAFYNITVVTEFNKAVVLFGSSVSQRLEPMSVVGNIKASSSVNISIMVSSDCGILANWSCVSMMQSQLLFMIFEKTSCPVSYTHLM